MDQDAERRACETEAQMTDEERFSLLVSVMGVNTINPVRDERIPEGVPMSAGYTPGVPRLGVPALLMSDASLGVTNPGYRPGDTATALPAGIALGASFNRALARESGVMLAKEARSRGFNVQLAGGINLMRDPRNGRNFEYLSEDPLLSAELAAESIKGIQSEGVISTIKHYSLNCNETNRHWLDAIIDPDAHRESDLLAFQLAIEAAQPGAVMTGYNKINGEYAGGNSHLLNDVLKGAWGYKGWVMSDWGATADWDFALKGLDQESGAQADMLFWNNEWFVEPLKTAYAEGRLPKARLSDMVRRILYSIYAVGVDQQRPAPQVDMAVHRQIALEAAHQGIVLLKNDGLLPLDPSTPAHIAVIGGYAQLGVPAGTGSSAVLPPGGYAAVVPIGGPGLMGPSRNLYLMPSSPYEELQKALSSARFTFDPGMFAAEAATLARHADLVIFFAIRPEGEGYDLPDLSLPWGQDAVIEAVASANPNTIVILETGNPVAMPWHDRVRGIVEAWFPGMAGGEAIVNVLTGKVNPSGRLPVTFPVSLDQTPRPELSGLGTPWGTPTTVRYDEGAEVGHRWFAKTGAEPLYQFGFGLGYTTFVYSDLHIAGGETVSASFTVTNAGERVGADVPQLYLTEVSGDRRLRLLGFDRVELEPGESRRVTLSADPRLLARFEGTTSQWHLAGGTYRIALAKSAGQPVLSAEMALSERRFGS